LSPEQVVECAADAGITHLALTDHDTFAGVFAARTRASQLGIELIPGIEFSCVWRNRGVHVVGLNIDIEHTELTKATEYMAQCRAERNLEIDRQLAKLGFKDSLAGACQFANGDQVGRPHFAQHLVATGVVKDVAQAFKRYLGTGKVGDVKQQWPELATVVGWINCAGGVAVIAHPLKYDFTRTKLIQLCNEFKQCGGSALEVISGGDQAPAQTLDMAKICRQVGLVGSLGSDFHMPDLRWQAFGSCGELPPDLPGVWSLWA